MDSSKRLFQCPGCWAFGLFPVPRDGWIQCECGELRTLVDLRERTERLLTENER